MVTRITAGQIVIGDEQVVTNGAILIEEGEILAVGPAGELDSISTPVDREYELPEHTLLPGLIDGHVHLSLTGKPLIEESVGRSTTEVVLDVIQNARRTLDAGITTVRDLGSPADTVLAVRDRIETGELYGPRIIAAGEGLVISGGHGVITPLHLDRAIATGSIATETDGPTAVTKAVRNQIARGADLIKVYASGGMTETTEILNSRHFSDEELAAAVAEADRQNVPVTAHAHPPESILAAVEAGVRSIEHGMFMDDETIDAMAANETYLVSTLSIMDKLANSHSVPKNYRENAKAALDHHVSMLSYAREKGVKLCMGTDVGAIVYANGENAYELECFERAGIPATEVISIATKQTAELLGLDDEIGLLAEGYTADLIAVDGDPLEDISILQDQDQISLVVKEGEVMKDLTRSRAEPRSAAHVGR